MRPFDNAPHVQRHPWLVSIGIAVGVATLGIVYFLCRAGYIAVNATKEDWWITEFSKEVPSALVTGVGILITYAVLNRSQQRLGSTKLLHELEYAQLELHRSEGGRQQTASGMTRCTFNWLTTRQVPSQDRKPEAEIIEGRRFWRLNDDGYLVDSLTAHEALFWFRRIWRALDDKLLNERQLYELWRYIVPFISDGRYSFYKTYFKNDAHSIRNVGIRLLQIASKSKQSDPIVHVCEPCIGTNARIDKLFLAELVALGHKKDIEGLPLAGTAFPAPGPRHEMVASPPAASGIVGETVASSSATAVTDD
jgi:hypothetical protein